MAPKKEIRKKLALEKFYDLQKKKNNWTIFLVISGAEMVFAHLLCSRTPFPPLEQKRCSDSRQREPPRWVLARKKKGGFARAQKKKSR